MARHACGTGCSHTYKSHAPGQCSKARNNILVCRAWHCCQLNPPTRGGGGFRKKPKTQTKTHKSQTTQTLELKRQTVPLTCGSLKTLRRASRLLRPGMHQAKEQGARHGSSVFLQNQHISFSSAQGTESKHQDSIKSPPSFCLPGRLGIGNPYNTHHT